MKKHLFRATALLAAISLAGACGSDDTADSIGSDVTTLVETIDTTLTADTATPIDTVVDGEASDEGTAMEAAKTVMTSLMAMPDGGEPTVANFEAAAATLPAGVELTGLDDGDEDGRDDDAKATIEANNGEDKACVQQQDGMWEVTDDEC
jgi:hypothetical protein